ncbi:Fe-S protein assembly co-chaperone HscB [Hydrogenophaga sp.]|uniref:Fe-S protein assembly co-chaperone HscB n=1 Tax=Hydrogenophaga sp. TaxID=1904254 RepID=UPI0019C9D530|nr:Fe-S protein assembly co-chaperone HscB [Hydrogenophaga sp.]MBD3892315.1 Fe-S protein assembly co-chaperone HscB [Hydrogenophaga sp.]
MPLHASDFEIFALPARFAFERDALDQRWRDLQRSAHPDRFASADAATQRLAMQWSVRINEAYQRLKDPQKRAAYLCEQHGVPVQAEQNTAMPAAFLQQQMEWREALDEARSATELEHLAAAVAQARTELLGQMQRSADELADFDALAQQVRALMFVERFARAVEQRSEPVQD